MKILPLINVVVLTLLRHGYLYIFILLCIEMNVFHVTKFPTFAGDLLLVSPDFPQPQIPI
jgi:hypothetical protein